MEQRQRNKNRKKKKDTGERGLDAHLTRRDSCYGIVSLEEDGPILCPKHFIWSFQLLERLVDIYL